MTPILRRAAVSAPLLFLLSAGLQAQQDRLSARIDKSRRQTLRGYIHPKARPQYDQGAVEPTFVTRGITLQFKPSATQQSDLQSLLGQQQDPSSPTYHHWLTPEQYGDRFGLSQNDVDNIKQWLESEGFTVTTVGRARTWISFTGTAAQVSSSLGAELHRYVVNGEAHFANANEPSIPAALSQVVSGIRGLNDFRPKSRLKPHPDATQGGTHHIVPDDLAAIYDIGPLYNSGVNGSGVKIVVVGQTRIQTADITKFRSNFNLPAINLQTVLEPGRTDPGLSSDDLPEADLDIEWSSSVARNSNIIYVYTDDVFEAARYAIDQNLGNVMTMSYGECEAMDLVDLPTFQGWIQQANAQGITFMGPGGDAGAADCEDLTANVAQVGLAVDVPAAIPEVTAVGGTEFNEGGGTYWSTTNTANGASALSYIPETVWNDTSAAYGLSAGGGGVSIFFPKPTWQTGTGVPNDGFRDVPDVSLAASPAHDAFYVYTGGSAQFYGGTSVSAPMFAGMVALANHYLMSTGVQSQAGLGNINPTLYQLSQKTSNVFHDITSGNNSVPCASGSPNCSNGTVGYRAATGYDLATGLGSVDVNNMVHQWAGNSAISSAVVASIDQTPVYQQAADANGYQWKFNISLTEEGGVPTTLTTFTANGVDYSSQIASLFGSTSIPARGTISTPLGFKTLIVPKNVVFTFGGTDASGRTWTEQLSAPFIGAQVSNFIAGVSNAASGQQVFAPGMIMSVYGVQMGLATQIATAVPLPGFLSGISAWVNNVNAPIYFVSPNQVNIQIPYETPTGKATLEIDTPYQVQTYNFTVSAAGPGIFLNNDGSVNLGTGSGTGTRGQTYTMFITGDGKVSPTVTTGSTPSRGTPKPTQSVSMTIGNVPATIQFIGIPSWSVGVTQINFTIPSTAAVGKQPVVVTVGNTASAAATLTVQ